MGQLTYLYKASSEIKKVTWHKNQAAHDQWLYRILAYAYKMFAPSVVTVAEKERMLTEVVNKEPTYFKGSLTATAKIAENYPTAIEHTDKVMNNLLSEGLPGIEESDERNRWLHCNSKTFSTVHEAIQYLESI